MILETKVTIFNLSIRLLEHKTQTTLSKRAKALSIFNAGGEKKTQVRWERITPRGKEGIENGILCTQRHMGPHPCGGGGIYRSCYI